MEHYFFKDLIKNGPSYALYEFMKSLRHRRVKIIDADQVLGTGLLEYQEGKRFQLRERTSDGNVAVHIDELKGNQRIVGI